MEGVMNFGAGIESFEDFIINVRDEKEGFTPDPKAVVWPIEHKNDFGLLVRIHDGFWFICPETTTYWNQNHPGFTTSQAWAFEALRKCNTDCAYPELHRLAAERMWEVSQKD